MKLDIKEQFALSGETVSQFLRVENVGLTPAKLTGRVWITKITGASYGQPRKGPYDLWKGCELLPGQFCFFPLAEQYLEIIQENLYAFGLIEDLNGTKNFFLNDLSGVFSLRIRLTNHRTFFRFLKQEVEFKTTVEAQKLHDYRLERTATSYVQDIDPDRYHHHSD